MNKDDRLATGLVGALNLLSFVFGDGLGAGMARRHGQAPSESDVVIASLAADQSRISD
jgi:hypothetical protein